jgi:phosphoribosylaminoimidazolecarboxamide formyltransferase / IMP cyclohydrolase
MIVDSPGLAQQRELLLVAPARIAIRYTIMSKRAILSVYDKSNLLELARVLQDANWEIIASGGTARSLREAGIPVRDVAEVTGTPEMLGGRVKTLHPAIHAGVLARDLPDDWADLREHNITPIDMVVCNLYPFSETIARPAVTEEAAIEQIDIGGVTLLRAAAKNFSRVTVVCDPADYARVIKSLGHGESEPDLRRELAVKAFAHTRDYDEAITSYLAKNLSQHEQESLFPQLLHLSLIKVQDLRYGENPHQPAVLYGLSAHSGPLGGRLLQGKALSYNNLLDLDAAWRAASAYDGPAVAIVKHLSPCGIAIGETVAMAFLDALASDTVSAFGGVIALNRPVDGEFVTRLEKADLFVEAIIAPDFSAETLGWFAAKKKNCRLVATGTNSDEKPLPDMRAVRGGILIQARDEGDPESVEWQVVSRREPAEQESMALRFAWIAVQHVKSNAIVLANTSATVGIGGGLSSRVDAVKLAVMKAGVRAEGAVMASDAFFPFADGIETAAAAGVTAVVEPGGSVRDDEVIAAANRLNLTLVFTGARHFRH